MSRTPGAMSSPSALEEFSKPRNISTRRRSSVDEMREIARINHICVDPSTLKAAEKYNTQPYYMQGDLDMYTEENLAKREALRHDREVLQRIDKFWNIDDVVSMKDRAGMLTLKGYEKLFIRVQKTLIPEWSLATALRQCGVDWKKDMEASSSRRAMDSTAFYDAMFELVDHWAETCKADEYVAFLDTVYDSVTRMAEKEHRILRKIKAVSFIPGMRAAVKERAIINSGLLDPAWPDSSADTATVSEGQAGIEGSGSAGDAGSGKAGQTGFNFLQRGKSIKEFLIKAFSSKGIAVPADSTLPGSSETETTPVEGSDRDRVTGLAGTGGAEMDGKTAETAGPAGRKSVFNRTFAKPGKKGGKKLKGKGKSKRDLSADGKASVARPEGDLYDPACDSKESEDGLAEGIRIDPLAFGISNPAGAEESKLSEFLCSAAESDSDGDSDARKGGVSHSSGSRLGVTELSSVAGLESGGLSGVTEEEEEEAMSRDRLGSLPVVPADEFPVDMTASRKQRRPSTSDGRSSGAKPDFMRLTRASTRKLRPLNLKHDSLGLMSLSSVVMFKHSMKRNQASGDVKVTRPKTASGGLTINVAARPVKMEMEAPSSPKAA